MALKIHIFFIFLIGLFFSNLASVVELTDENFAELTVQGDWLIKFYAPWCKHCKTLIPVFEELSDQVVGILNVGTLDATKHKKVAHQFKVKKYPTIMYKKDNFYGNYDGPRTLNEFVGFAHRLSSPPFMNVTNIDDLKAVSTITDQNITFLLSIPPISEHASTSTDVFNDFAAVANKMYLHASFAVLEQTQATQPFTETLSLPTDRPTLLKVELGRQSVFMSADALMSAEDRVAGIEAFVERNNHPLISELDNHNFKRLSYVEKIFLLAVVDFRQGSADDILRAFDSVVSAVPVEASSGLLFGHLDGVRFRKYIKSHAAVLPCLLVLDHKNELHHSFVLPSGKLDRLEYESAIKEVVDQVLYHPVDVEWNRSSPPSLLQKLLYRVRDYYPWSVIIIGLPVLIVVASFLVPFPSDKKKKRE